jgi:hypothetical protein
MLLPLGSKVLYGVCELPVGIATVPYRFFVSAKGNKEKPNGYPVSCSSKRNGYAPE